MYREHVRTFDAIVVLRGFCTNVAGRQERSFLFYRNSRAEIFITLKLL